MRKLRETHPVRKVLRTAVAAVLTVGLMPSMAFADLQAGSIDMEAQAESTEGFVICAGYAANEPAPQILGLNNPQYRSQTEAENVAAVFAQDNNSAADPYLVNMLAGETPSPVYGGRQGSPMSALLPYNDESDTGALSRQVWNMRPDIVLGTGSDAIPDNESTFYDTDEYARAAETANGWEANSYHPVGVTYNRVDLNAMINTMYRLAIAADTLVANSDGTLDTRYDSALSIAKDYERYITGAKGYVLKAINAGTVAKRTFACVQSYDSDAGTFQIRPSGIMQEGTATRNRLIEAVQGVANNYYDSSTAAADDESLKTVTVDELKNSVDLIIVNVNAGSDTDDGIINAMNSAGLLSKCWYASNMSAGAVFGTTVNSVENAQNVGRILPCLYPELLDQSDMIAFYYDTFYHIQSGSVASMVAEKMDGVRNWAASSSSDSAALLQWDEADVAGYNRLAVESTITEGMNYMLGLSADQIPDAVMTPSTYYAMDEVAPAATPVTDSITALDQTGATVEATDTDWAASAISAVAAGVAMSSQVAPITLDQASDAAKTVWQAAIDANAAAVTGFDVSLYVVNSEGKPVSQLTDNLNINVNLPVDSQYNNRYVQVTQIHDGQALETQTVVAKDGFVTVPVTQLSEFVVAVQNDEASIFDVYVQKYGEETPSLAKSYTASELHALATTDGDPISGLYFKGGSWNVSTAVTYVTLDSLFSDAGIDWGEGATIGYGGDPAQGKTANSFAYEDLQNLKFYPNTTATSADTSGAVDAPFVFGLTTSKSGIAIGEDQTAADVQKASVADSTTEYLPYAIMGSLESEYTAADGTTVAGKRLWRNVDAITVTLPEPTFEVYVQKGQETPTLAKSYKLSELEALATTDGDPISGLYFKGGSWNVSTALTYVTLDKLFADAGVEWGAGATIGYGGDPAQGKTANSFTYEDLQNLKFYPNTTATSADTSGAVDAPFVFGLSTSAGGVAIGEDQTAADVQAAAASAATTVNAPYAILGSLESEYTAGEGTTVAGKRLWRNVEAITVTINDTAPMYRLYNPHTGEHFYTASAEERDALAELGWTAEGIGWYAPANDQSVPVYRLYNANGGEHHYTTDASERDGLVAVGWTDEGIGWYSDPAETVALLREYNPNAYSCNHNYTTDQNEHDTLVSLGWVDEGKAWYAVAPGA